MRHYAHNNFVRPRAFTLIEALFAVFILAMAATGIASLLGTTYQQSAISESSSMSAALARQLIEEIAAKSVEDSAGAISLGPETGENDRSTFDQIDDYNNYTDTSANLTMIDGTPIALNDSRLYTRGVSVEYRSTPSGPATAAADAAFCVVTVIVTGDAPVTLTRVFTRVRSN